MRILPAGDSAVLVELGDLDQVLGYYAALVADPPEHLVDIVPAARTVMVSIAGDWPESGPTERPARPTERLARLTRHLQTIRPRAGTRSAGELLEIPVVYDGEDLRDVAEHLGCSTDEVVARHTADDWTVAFCGFAPGFGYLTGSGWSIPRRSTPRTKVPAGAVALAGEFTGVYPRESPGGWQLIGWTRLQIFNPDREPAALFHPGRRVRFVRDES